VRILEVALHYLIYAVRVVQKLGWFKKNSFLNQSQIGGGDLLKHRENPEIKIAIRLQLLRHNLKLL
jgi:hypothetical protein